ncbi:MAG: ParB/Srx family N-terminal domain-containing protein, partial [Hyphomonas sp.]|nr:ParB/Srx family N-terminal domain-containing protein [Hyphomonas sp.]
MSSKIRDLRVDYRPVSTLTAYAGNARTHSAKQLRQIAESIKTFGWTNPILIDEAGGVIAGHGRLEAARLLGLDRVPVICLAEMTEGQKRAYIIADNKLAENAGWDENLLRI